MDWFCQLSSKFWTLIIYSLMLVNSKMLIVVFQILECVEKGAGPSVLSGMILQTGLSWANPDINVDFFFFFPEKFLLKEILVSRDLPIMPKKSWGSQNKTHNLNGQTSESSMRCVLLDTKNSSCHVYINLKERTSPSASLFISTTSP